MVAGAAVKCVERAARGPALAGLVRRVDESVLVASPSRLGGSPVAEGAEQGAERNQPRLSETASEGRKEAPTRLAGLMRDGRARTQVLGQLGLSLVCLSILTSIIWPRELDGRSGAQSSDCTALGHIHSAAQPHREFGEQ